MKNLVIGFMVFFVFYACPHNGQSDKTVHHNLEVAQKQYTNMLDEIGLAEKNPRTISEDGSLLLVPSKDWTSGFFPGGLWYIYEYTTNEKWLNYAKHFTHNIEAEQFNAGTHDMGFKMFCSYGNGYRLTNDKEYREILLTSAKSLATRFNPVVGCIRSWDHSRKKYQYPVIIDNMLNLELLFWASSVCGDSIYYNIAVSHAEHTLKNHFRKDFSTWHVVDYDTLSGKVLQKKTHQGYADESSWARGQAWGLYGYTMTYRETKNKRFLDQATHIAEFILNHPNLPADLVPYWDFDTPEIPNTPRDASAAAIISSALFELQEYVPSKKAIYLKAANKILESLSSQDYLAISGGNNNFLLKHSVGQNQKNVEIDVPIIYADYYFLEANMRKEKMIGRQEDTY